MMKSYNITTIEEFFHFCQNNIKYGWIDQKGNKHSGINDAQDYSLQSPQELMNSELGICWDRTELYRAYFQNMTNLKYETYYLLYDDNNSCPSHSILVYYKDKKVFWFEPMFQSNECYYSGIHEYNNIDELLMDFKRVWINSSIINKSIPAEFIEEKVYIYRYTTPQYHINGYQMREHINNSEQIFL